MSYMIAQNVGKSLMQCVTDIINTNGAFVCGDGASMLTIYDAFPTDPMTFKIPSMSIEIERDMPRAQYDLGVQCTRKYNSMIDLWFDNKTASNYVASLIKEKLEKKPVYYRNYNLNANGACIIGNMWAKNISATPIRSPLPGNEGNYRHEVTFVLDYNDNY